MFKLIHGIVESYSDTAGFVEKIQHYKIGKKSFFDKDETIFISRAPGRLDVMGGMADYSGATVFESTIQEAIFCAVQKRKDKKVIIHSYGIDENEFEYTGSFTLDDLKENSKPASYEKLHKKFSSSEKNRWLTFPAGAFAVIMSEKKFDFPAGANIYLQSSVPLGKGVSSSAAFEISLLKAIVEAYRIPASHREIPYWAHLLENNVVGAPCGMMDQYASSHGMRGYLVPLVCQPDTVLDPVPVKEDIAFVGIDTGIRPKLTKQNYADVRVAAFMGYRIIADLLDLKVRKIEDQNHLVKIIDPFFDGYLANFRTSRFDDDFRDKLPPKMTGKAFIDSYQGITDPIVDIEPKRTYQIKVACENQVYENLRTVLFLQLLKAYDDTHDEQILISLGELMFLSHRSYAECGLGDKDITVLIRKIRKAGPRLGLYGAKISGSGTGGTIAVLLKKTAMPILKNLVEEFKNEMSVEPKMFIGNSPGAIEFDHLELKWFGK